MQASVNAASSHMLSEDPVFDIQLVVQVAQQLNMNSTRERKKVTPEQLVPELEAFCAEHMAPDRQHLVPSLRQLREAGFHELASRLHRCQERPKLALLLGKEFPLRGPFPRHKLARPKTTTSQAECMQSSSQSCSMKRSAQVTLWRNEAGSGTRAQRVSAAEPAMPLNRFWGRLTRKPVHVGMYTRLRHAGFCGISPHFGRVL
jgi:hypothetical protein